MELKWIWEKDHIPNSDHFMAVAGCSSGRRSSDSSPHSTAPNVLMSKNAALANSSPTEESSVGKQVGSGVDTGTRSLPLM